MLTANVLVDVGKQNQSVFNLGKNVLRPYSKSTLNEWRFILFFFSVLLPFLNS